MILALSGYASAGKDSVADVLVAERGFTKYSWADTLRLAAAALNPIVAWTVGGDVAWTVGGDDYYEGDGAIRYNDVITKIGYTEAKVRYPEVRLVLQRLGTEVGRNLISDNVWVDATLARIEREHSWFADIVIADTRFLNEAEAIKNLSSENLVVRVTRPGVGPESNHASEISLDGYDFDSHFSNDGDMDGLTKAVLDWYDFLEISL